MKIVMNETRKAVLGVLANATEPMTLSEIATAMGVDKISTGTTNAMITAGLIAKAGETTVSGKGTRSVSTYAFGCEPGKDTKVSMNDTRVAILATLRNASEPMTLDAIAKTLGVEKINPGVITPMLSAGMIENVGKAKVDTVTTKKVTTYKLGDNQVA